MRKIDWKVCGEWALEAYKLYKGKAYAKICAAAFALASALIPFYPWASAIIGILALLVFAFAAFLDSRSVSSSRSQIIALCHQSFEGNARRLSTQDLPKTLKNAKIHHKSIDQSQFYKNGILQGPEVALQIQSVAAAEMKTLLGANSQARFAYYGKAHIPLVFTLGYQMQGSSVLLFELDRQDGHWRPIEMRERNDMGVTVEKSGTAQPQGDAVIRVSISYPVAEIEITPVIPEPHTDIHIRIAQPKIDAIESREQVDAIAEIFRAALDELKSSDTPPARIHVFCAAPMSVVFAMGRRVSGTIHPPVTVYNYTSSTSPRYAWGVQLTGAPEPQIIHTKTAGVEDKDVQSA